MVQNMHKIISVNSFTNKLRLRAAVVNAVAVRVRSATRLKYAQVLLHAPYPKRGLKMA